MKVILKKRLRTDLGGLPVGTILILPHGDRWGPWAVSTVYGDEIVEAEQVKRARAKSKAKPKAANPGEGENDEPTKEIATD